MRRLFSIARSRTRLARRLGPLALAAGMGVVAAPAEGRQLGFSAVERGARTEFDYRYADAAGTVRSLRFTLPSAEVRASVQAFRRFDGRDLRQRTEADLGTFMAGELDGLRARYPDAEIVDAGRGRIRYAVSADGHNRQLKQGHRALLEAEVARLRQAFPDLRIALSPDNRVSVDGIRSQRQQRDVQAALDAAMRRVSSSQERRAAEAQARMRQRQAALSQDLRGAIEAAERRVAVFRAQYLSERAYAELSPGTLIPDYARVARESVPVVAPLVAAFRAALGGVDARAALDPLLAFFQTIPYDRLESRASGGAGFAYPVALFARNRGDCDTKSVAFASVFSQLYPGVPVVMVMLRDHALIGLGLPARAGERTVVADGQTYLLVEPVGPALLPAGAVGDQSRDGLRRGAQVLRLF